MEASVDLCSSTASNTESVETLDALKRKSQDIGWKFATLIIPGCYNKVRCNLCKKEINGGIYRLKQHVAHIRGNVAPCEKSTPLDRDMCMKAISGAKKKKIDKNEHIQEVRDDVNIKEADADMIDVEGITKQPHSLGPMDQYARPIDPVDSTTESRKVKRQQSINDVMFKNRTNRVHSYLACWVYESGIPFNSINSESFLKFVEAVGRFGPGYMPPSQYQLREPLLKEQVQKTKETMKEQEDEWKANGCSIMTDAWSDRKRRSIMNMCINCKLGTSFISSIESSSEAHTGKYIFEYVDKSIDEVGPKNVIQVVTDNATNNMAAAKLLKIKRPNIFWTSCATHTLNLILEGIGKIPKFQGIIDRAKALTIFIYAHHKTLALMRKFTKKRDIIRPGVTRFASSFLSMQSILEKEESLKFMFASTDWRDWKWSTTKKGVKAYQTVFSRAFWSNMKQCVEIFKPLVKVLRLVDGDCRPSMPYVYGELKEATNEIKTLFTNERDFEPILEIIEAKAKGRLDSPLHVAGYMLNPYYYYKDKEVQKDGTCMMAMMACIENFFPDNYDMQDLVANVELVQYQRMEGLFGKKLAVMGRMRNDDKFDIVAWWTNYGSETPNLQMMALKIVALTSSSSGCERNWSAFEGIHTKKRNRLDVERLNNLVYVQFNSKLANKKIKVKDKFDMLVANDASKAQGWIVEGGDDEEVYDDSTTTISEIQGRERPSVTSSGRAVRELYEEDFQSDNEEENDDKIDDEIVIEEKEDHVGRW